MDDFGLRREQLALEAGDDELAMCLRLAGIDRRVGAVERIEQFIAELADEILKAQGERRRCRFEQIALHGRGLGGGGFEIEGHGDAPMKMGQAPPPTGAMTCPVVGEETAWPSWVERISTRWAAATS